MWSRRKPRWKPKNYSTSTSNKSGKSRSDHGAEWHSALPEINSQMCANRPLRAGNVMVDGRVQDPVSPVLRLDNHGGGTASIQTHTCVGALIDEQLRKLGKGGTITVKRLASVHDDQVQVTPIAVDANCRARVQFTIIQILRSLALE